ncbi:TPA: hypothetical protein ACSPZB_001800, partial [Citrobacter freundii]
SDFVYLTQIEFQPLLVKLLTVPQQKSCAKNSLIPKLTRVSKNEKFSQLRQWYPISTSAARHKVR